MVSSSPEASEVVREGDVIAGKYRIERILGVGGMGIVVAAQHLQLEELVAIKFLRPEGLENPEVVSRFDREARAAVRIKNEHVAHVLDVGKLDNGIPYMVMEYLEGMDLAAWVLQHGVLPVDQAVDFLLQACEAIADAHALGIVHRDLKPANLFCLRGSDGLLFVKVLDFGISKISGISGAATSMGDTRATAILGSPHYMSPEQMQSSRNVDSRADIWGLGITLYELLSGIVPFTGDTVTEVCVRIATAPAPPLRELRPDLPPGLEAVIQRCLEKDRNRRFPNVAELAAALAPFGPKRARGSVDRIARISLAAGITAPSDSLPPSSTSIEPGAAARTLASWGKTSSDLRRRPMFAIFALLAGAVAAIVVGLVLSRETVSPAGRPTYGESGSEPAAALPEAATSAGAPPAAVDFDAGSVAPGATPPDEVPTERAATGRAPSRPAKAPTAGTNSAQQAGAHLGRPARPSAPAGSNRASPGRPTATTSASDPWGGRL